MNPAKSYAHLFSPLGGEGGENYRAPGQLTFLRAPHVALETAALKAHGARYAFVGVPFDEGNVGKPGSEDGPREFRIASQEYLSYWFEFGVDLNGLAVDCGDVPMPKVNPDSARERIYRAVTTVLEGRRHADHRRRRQVDFDPGGARALRPYRRGQEDGLSPFRRASRPRRQLGRGEAAQHLRARPHHRTAQSAGRQRGPYRRA